MSFYTKALYKALKNSEGPRKEALSRIINITKRKDFDKYKQGNNIISDEGSDFLKSIYEKITNKSNRNRDFSKNSVYSPDYSEKFMTREKALDKRADEILKNSGDVWKTKTKVKDPITGTFINEEIDINNPVKYKNAEDNMSLEELQNKEFDKTDMQIAFEEAGYNNPSKKLEKYADPEYKFSKSAEEYNKDIDSLENFIMNNPRVLEKYGINKPINNDYDITEDFLLKAIMQREKEGMFPDVSNRMSLYYKNGKIMPIFKKGNSYHNRIRTGYRPKEDILDYENFLQAFDKDFNKIDPYIMQDAEVISK